MVTRHGTLCRNEVTDCLQISIQKSAKGGRFGFKIAFQIHATYFEVP
jgi:hypothetical protein